MGYAQIREVTVEEDGRLKVEGLPVRAGERVQVVIIRQQSAGTGLERHPLHGHSIQYEAPFEPAADPNDWEANR